MIQANANANFSPENIQNELRELISQLLPLVPLVEPLKEMFAGKVAGEGATAAQGKAVSEKDFANTDPAKERSPT